MPIVIKGYQVELRAEESHGKIVQSLLFSPAGLFPSGARRRVLDTEKCFKTLLEWLKSSTPRNFGSVDACIHAAEKQTGKDLFSELVTEADDQRRLANAGPLESVLDSYFVTQSRAIPERPGTAAFFDALTIRFCQSIDFLSKQQVIEFCEIPLEEEDQLPPAAAAASPEDALRQERDREAYFEARRIRRWQAHSRFRREPELQGIINSLIFDDLDQRCPPRQAFLWRQKSLETLRLYCDMEVRELDCRERLFAGLESGVFDCALLSGAEGGAGAGDPSAPRSPFPELMDYLSRLISQNSSGSGIYENALVARWVLANQGALQRQIRWGNGRRWSFCDSDILEVDVCEQTSPSAAARRHSFDHTHCQALNLENTPFSVASLMNCEDSVEFAQHFAWAGLFSRFRGDELCEKPRGSQVTQHRPQYSVTDGTEVDCFSLVELLAGEAPICPLTPPVEAASTVCRVLPPSRRVIQPGAVLLINWPEHSGGEAAHTFIYLGRGIVASLWHPIRGQDFFIGPLRLFLQETLPIIDPSPDAAFTWPLKTLCITVWQLRPKRALKKAA